MKSIIVRYGELTLKGKNKDYFVSKLIRNIKFKLKDEKENLVFIKDHNSLSIEVKNEKVIQKVIDRLQTVFGIYSLSVSEKVGKDVDEIKAKLLEVASSLPKSTFKLEVTRKDKGFPIGSQEFKTELAGHILRNTDQLTVDVHNPDNKIDIVIKHDGTFIFTSKLASKKGLPVGVSGSALSLISGGIDSPVASYLTLKRGMLVNFLHFMTPPHTTPEAVQKVFDLVAKIAPYNLSSFTLYVCDFGDLLTELRHMEEPSYRITIMRRIFMRVANDLGNKIGAQAIVTGESLGQVASQTIESINVINKSSTLPVIRPLIAYDKEEIIKIAKELDTYEISIRPFDDVCSLYVPKNPVTKPKLKVVEDIEDGLMWKQLVDAALESKIKAYIWRDGGWIEKENKE